MKPYNFFFVSSMIMALMLELSSTPLFAESENCWTDPVAKIQWCYMGQHDYVGAAYACKTLGQEWNLPNYLNKNLANSSQGDFNTSLSQAIFQSSISPLFADLVQEGSRNAIANQIFAPVMNQVFNRQTPTNYSPKNLWYENSYKNTRSPSGAFYITRAYEYVCSAPVDANLDLFFAGWSKKVELELLEITQQTCQYRTALKRAVDAGASNIQTRLMVVRDARNDNSSTVELIYTAEVDSIQISTACYRPL